MGRNWGGETIIRICCMKRNLFSVKEKSNFFQLIGLLCCYYIKNVQIQQILRCNGQVVTLIYISCQNKLFCSDNHLC